MRIRLCKVFGRARPFWRPQLGVVRLDLSWVWWWLLSGVPSRLDFAVSGFAQAPVGPLSRLEERANWEHIVGSECALLAARAGVDGAWLKFGAACVPCSQVYVLIIGMGYVKYDSILCPLSVHTERIRHCSVFF